jgi:hypothetical protein
VVGAVFIGFLMMPGSMYLQLVIGSGIGPAARLVTIILFAEIAKRSYTELKQQEIFLLYYMPAPHWRRRFPGCCGTNIWSSPMPPNVGPGGIYPDLGGAGAESDALASRTFFHRDWLIPILLLVGSQIIQRIDHFGLGYTL